MLPLAFPPKVDYPSRIRNCCSGWHKLAPKLTGRLSTAKWLNDFQETLPHQPTNKEQGYVPNLESSRRRVVVRFNDLAGREFRALLWRGVARRVFPPRQEGGKQKGATEEGETICQTSQESTLGSFHSSPPRVGGVLKVGQVGFFVVVSIQLCRRTLNLRVCLRIFLGGLFGIVFGLEIKFPS